MNLVKVKISEVKNNPKNPRVIKDFKYRKLVKSIKAQSLDASVQNNSCK